MSAEDPAPTIEVLLPYVGDEAYAREAVESVLSQSDPDWRLTVVEDGPQGTSLGAWIIRLDDRRISYVQNAETLGVARNFQKCLDMAIGDYVTFLGCDDRLAPSYIEKMRQTVRRHPEVAVVQPSVRVIDENGSPVMPLSDRLKVRLAPTPHPDRALTGEPLLATLLRGNWTYFPSLLWHRQSLAMVGFRPDLTITPDLVALATLVLKGHQLLFIADRLFDYRRHRMSVSSRAASSADRFVEERVVLNELGAAAARQGWQSSARAARLRLASRMHAASLIPAAVRSGELHALTAYLRHVAGS